MKEPRFLVNTVNNVLVLKVASEGDAAAQTTPFALTLISIVLEKNLHVLVNLANRKINKFILYFLKNVSVKLASAGRKLVLCEVPHEWTEQLQGQLRHFNIAQNAMNAMRQF